ncbi:beta-ketoacyl-[acyl-carrier-protein] synthase family protein [Actinomadura violacea]|uniref:Beta-ketoacyl-[acyl-carrier-protein] synthase family protein n=1 Tax=Actinomadura violacea TaxID=2819934 RepID=A0ABS3RNK1_9ACTN|nr:beta-ketoacyl-[acyl-carrier-protein] synthase family protein [Actinomadura violacea]MBO2458326.1 beta-ketoacyl-[acyl-carrier-protein] synthase family protein [Actinomadura violacea]
MNAVPKAVPKAGPKAPVRRRRVVVTGIGPVTSIGTGADAFRRALRAGRDGAGPITGIDVAGFEHTQGCEVRGFDPAAHLDVLDPAEWGRAALFTATAARLAVADAGLDAETLRPLRTVVAVGTTDGESQDLDALVRQRAERGPSAMDPALARRVAPIRLAVAAARELGLTDVEPLTVSTACAAGNYAIGHSLDAVGSGAADIALCGGADALCRKTFAGFYRLGTIAPERCRPFDADRNGILTGEGAGMLVLEPLEAALRRGARVYAEVLGYGLNCDADHPVAPNEESIARCMRLALEDAGVKPSDVDLVSAHGTGTRANDVTETRAIRRVHGDDPPRTVSVKSMIGHTMGAAGALASAACALSIHHGFVPPTINHRRTDPECAIDCVPNRALPVRPRIVQNNALAFGGTNCVLILGRCDEAERGGAR